MNILEPNLAGVYVGKIYKLTKYVAKWRLQMVVKYNGFVTFFSRLFSFYFISSASPQVEILVRFRRLMAQKTSSDWYRCLLKVWCLQIQYEGVSGPKIAKFWTVKVGTCRFLAKNASTLEPPRVNYP